MDNTTHTTDVESGIREIIQQSLDRAPSDAEVTQVVELPKMNTITTQNVEGDAHEIVSENLDSVIEMKNIVTENGNYVPTESSSASSTEGSSASSTESSSTSSEESIDYESVVSIRKMLYESKASFSSTLCIYRSPEGVRVYNKDAYVPELINLGSQHLIEEESTSEKELKRSYCKKLIDRSNKDLDFFIKHLEDRRTRVYGCYNNDDWGYFNVTLFHACFIVEHLIRSYYPELREPSDNLPLMERRRNQIKRDLILLDNQIPYFLLESLYDLIDPLSLSPTKERSPSFNDLVVSFFKEYNKRSIVPADFGSVKHFTDLIRTLHKPTISQSEEQSRSDHFELTASATQLYSAGVVFKTVRGTCLLDIKFKNGHLEIPSFELNDDQESLFRNLIAFELCHYPDDTFIIDYFVFLDTLINTADDVSLLIRAGVLVNRIGDHSDAANTFNKFCGGITHYRASNSYLVPVLRDLNEYYKKPKHTWMTTFKRDYFGSPLRIVSTIAAFLLVVLTFVSTVCSIVSIS